VTSSTAKRQPGRIQVDAAGRTRAGREREHNQDHYLVAKLSKSLEVEAASIDLGDRMRLRGRPQGRLLLVADGMGGHAHGEEASRIAVDTVLRYVANAMPWFLDGVRRSGREEASLADELRAALHASDERVHEAGDRQGGRRRMGTTLTMACVLWPELYVVHAGDSRCYLLRNGELRQLTRDHTLVQALVDEGAIDAEQARRHRLRNVVENVVGGGERSPLRPDVERAELETGDVLLLCSDGLTNDLDDDAIREALAAGRPASESAEDLLERAGAQGGGDDTTVVVARFG